MGMILNPYAAIPVLSDMKLDPLTVDGGGVIFTNSDKTIENTSNPGFALVKSAYARRTGKWYWEVVLNGLTTGTTVGTSLGLTRPDYPMALISQEVVGASVWLSAPATVSYLPRSRSFIAEDRPQSGAGSDIGATQTAGDIISFAVDLDAGLAWVRNNGGTWNSSTVGADPATGAGGRSLQSLKGFDLTPYSMLYFQTDKHTYHFASGEFARTPPTGFLPWITDVQGDNSDKGFIDFTLGSRSSTNFTASNAQRTLTKTTTSGTQQFWSALFKTKGKVYVEFSTSGDWYVLSNTNNRVGISSMRDLAAGGETGVASVYADGRIRINSTTVLATIGAFGATDVIGMAVDIDNKLIWFRRNNGNWNNDPTANPATGTGGFSFPWDHVAPKFSLYSGSGSTGITINGGQDAYAFSPPSGFGNWKKKNG